jgi:hypothetical protein
LKIALLTSGIQDQVFQCFCLKRFLVLRCSKLLKVASSVFYVTIFRCKICGLAWFGSSANTIMLYRNTADPDRQGSRRRTQKTKRLGRAPLCRTFQRSHAISRSGNEIGINCSREMKRKRLLPVVGIILKLLLQVFLARVWDKTLPPPKTNDEIPSRNFGIGLVSSNPRSRTSFSSPRNNIPLRDLKGIFQKRHAL